MFEVFDAWEPLVKAREAKGLGKWKKLETIAGKLQGKKAEHITFTCSHPSHDGEEVRHVLGSTTGNLHFLMGYGSPGFCLAPYHWLVMDPNLDEKEAKSFEHPAKPEFWKASGLPITQEGDPEEGKPHPKAARLLTASAKEDKLNQEAVRGKNGYRHYLGVPSLGLVFGLNNNQVYKWDLIKESFFAVTNPDFATAMNGEEEATVKSFSKKINTFVLPAFKTSSNFSDDVYPLVKSRFPKPGSIIQLPSKNGDVIGIVKSNSVDFYDKNGDEVSILVYDLAKKSLDLRVNGTVHPDVIFNFAKSILNIDTTDLTEDQNLVKGSPTLGFESVSASKPRTTSERKVVTVDGYSKVVP